MATGLADLAGLRASNPAGTTTGRERAASSQAGRQVPERKHHAARRRIYVLPAHAPREVRGMPFPSWSESVFTALVVILVGIVLLALVVVAFVVGR